MVQREHRKAGREGMGRGREGEGKREGRNRREEERKVRGTGREGKDVISIVIHQGIRKS